MKKNFKRKNYVLIGAIGIAAVALTSVGFATWITGMQQTTATNNISVTVDTAQNSTKYLEVVIDSDNDEMHIGEKVTSGAITNSGNATDLEIAFTKFQLIIGDKYKSTQLENVKVEMAVSNLPTGITFTNGGFVPTDLYEGAENTYKKSYLQFPTTFGEYSEVDKKFYVKMKDLTEAEKSANLKGYTVKKAVLVDDTKLTLAWGTLFGGDSPATYYNGLMPENTDVETKLGIMDTATKTLNHMSSLLNGKTLTYTFTVTGLPE